MLALAFGGGELNPLQVLVFGLAVGGMGYNVYFLYRWFRALARGGRKGVTLVVEAAEGAGLCRNVARLVPLGVVEG